jgi:hypothetical protein
MKNLFKKISNLFNSTKTKTIKPPCLHWLEETDNLVFLDDPNLPRRI